MEIDKLSDEELEIIIKNIEIVMYSVGSNSDQINLIHKLKSYLGKGVNHG